MRVVVLFRGFTFGGIERYVSAVTGGLSDRGVDWEVWHPDRAFATEVVGSNGTGSIEARDVTRGGRSFLQHFRIALAGFRKFDGPFSVFLNESSPGLFVAAGLAARLAGARRIVNVSHWVTPEEAGRWGGGQLGLWKCGTAAAMRTLGGVVSSWVAPVEAARRSLVCQFGVPADKTRLIAHGVPVPEAAGSGSERGGELVFCGRLSHEKGLDVLIEALSLLRARFDCGLTVVGDGPEKSALRKQAGRLGVSDRVRWLGFQSYPGEYIRSADVCVVPSRSESVGLSLLEAMSHGVASVASRVGGMGELLRDGVEGLYVEPDCPTALAAAIGRVLEDRGLRAELGSAARARVVSDYSQSRMVDETLGLLL